MLNVLGDTYEDYVDCEKMVLASNSDGPQLEDTHMEVAHFDLEGAWRLDESLQDLNHDLDQAVDSPVHSMILLEENTQQVDTVLFQMVVRIDKQAHGSNSHYPEVFHKKFVDQEDIQVQCPCQSSRDGGYLQLHCDSVETEVAICETQVQKEGEEKTKEEGGNE